MLLNINQKKLLTVDLIGKKNTFYPFSLISVNFGWLSTLLQSKNLKFFKCIYRMRIGVT